MAKTAEEIIQAYNRLKSERTVWEHHWQELADYVLPRKNNITTQTTPGEKKHADLLDNTAMLSNEKLAGALHGLLTSNESQWFELTTGNVDLDEDDDVREWLYETARVILLTLNNSNFQTEVHELYLDLCAFGTSPMCIEEDEKRIVRFSSKPIQSVVIDENHMGTIDTIYLYLEWDIRKIIGQLGMDALTEKMREHMRSMMSTTNAGQAEKTFPLIYTIYPANEMGRKDKGNKKFVYEWVSVSDKQILKTGGFNEFPWVCPRWSKVSGEKYGRGPAMVALPEAKMVNKMQETVLQGAQKVVNPPLQVPHDGFLLPLNTKPGGILVRLPNANPNAEIRPILNDTRIDFGQQVMEDVRNRIRQAFFDDLLQLKDGPQMTAAEVLQRSEETMRLLGPLLGRQNYEFLAPLIERVYAILERRGKIPAVPEALNGQEVRVQYSSMIAKAQRVNEATSILRFFEAAQNFIALDPASAEVMDNEEAVRILARTYGVPTRVIRKKADLEKVREARAQAESEVNAMREQAQQAQIAQTQAQTNAQNAQAQLALL